MRLGERATEIRAAGRKALVAFLTAGYPDEETFVEVARAAVEAGCDAVEVGVPFSDPIADGPVIQASSAASLSRGMTLAGALSLAGGLASRNTTPLIIMSYINPILAYGVVRFADDAAEAGVSGVILPDVSFEESPPFRAALGAAGVETVDLIAPTSSDERVAMIAREAAGFLYLVSTTGVTGARRASSIESLPAFVERVRSVTDVPLYVGFGVSTPEDAAAVARTADGVIIGSQLIREIDAGEAGGASARVGGFVERVRRAIDTLQG